VGSEVYHQPYWFGWDLGRYSSYSKVLRKIRNGNEVCAFSNDITAQNSILVFLRMEAEHSSKLVEALAASIGDNIAAKKIKNDC